MQYNKHPPNSLEADGTSLVGSQTSACPYGTGKHGKIRLSWEMKQSSGIFSSRPLPSQHSAVPSWLWDAPTPGQEQMSHMVTVPEGPKSPRHLVPPGTLTGRTAAIFRGTSSHPSLTASQALTPSSAPTKASLAFLLPLSGVSPGHLGSTLHAGHLCADFWGKKSHVNE